MRILLLLLLNLGITYATIVMDPENGPRATAARRCLERQREQTTQNLVSTQSGIQVREENRPTENIHTQPFIEVIRLIIERNLLQQTLSTLTENGPHEEKHTLSDVAIHLSELETRLDISSAAFRQAMEHATEFSQKKPI